MSFSLCHIKRMMAARSIMQQNAQKLLRRQRVTCHMSHVTWHMSHVTCHMSHGTLSVHSLHLYDFTDVTTTDTYLDTFGFHWSVAGRLRPVSPLTLHYYSLPVLLSQGHQGWPALAMNSPGLPCIHMHLNPSQFQSQLIDSAQPCVCATSAWQCNGAASFSTN
jgi:hypothetical protein